MRRPSPALFMAFALAGSALTAACSPSAPEQQQARPQAQAAPPIGVDLAGLDPSVKPGDDFEQYANGGWRKVTEIPADRSSTGVFYEMFKRTEARNRGLIEEASKANAEAGTPQRLVADYHVAYMDGEAIEARGMAPMQPRLRAIDKIASTADLSRALGADLRADVDPLNATNFQTEHLFGLFVTQALSDPTRTVPYLLQGGLGMPDRDYYLSKDADMAKLRTAYRTYVETVLKLAGVSEPAKRAERIVALENRIAAAHLDRTASEDVHKANNPWTIDQLKTNAPGIDWDQFLKAAQLDGQPMMIIWQPGAVKGLSALVASQALQAWKDWMTFHTINMNSDTLPKAIDDASFAFYGKTLEGTPQQRERWKRSLSHINGELGDALGRIYAERFFPASSKAEVQSMVTNILNAFGKRVDALPWMAAETKLQAKAKINSLRVGVGYPETWRDYAGLEIRRDDPLGNVERSQLWEYRHQLAKLGKPVDRSEWWMVPQTVNAVNLPLQNALNFPAAILEPPFFDPKVDPAANYGSIGAIIGHEISHSFDNTGAEFSASGKLESWWTPADLAHFKAASQKLVAQYATYEPLPGVHLNGALTLGENIADVAGLSAAYDAYRFSLGGKEAPVIGGLTGDQRFFLAYAQSWRQKTRDEALKQQIVTDGHAPARERAQTVRNLDAWYGAFGVQPGALLYLKPEDRVRIW